MVISYEWFCAVPLEMDRNTLGFFLLISTSGSNWQNELFEASDSCINVSINFIFLVEVDFSVIEYNCGYNNISPRSLKTIACVFSKVFNDSKREDVQNAMGVDPQSARKIDSYIMMLSPSVNVLHFSLMKILQIHRYWIRHRSCQQAPLEFKYMVQFKYKGK